MNINKNIVGLSLLATASLLPLNLNAQSCTLPPNCDALGFTKTAADCTNAETLRCPFDQTKVFCSKPTSSSNGSGNGIVGSNNPMNTFQQWSRYYDDNGNFLGYLLKYDQVCSSEAKYLLYHVSTKKFSTYREAYMYCSNLTLGGLTWKNRGDWSAVYSNFVSYQISEDYGKLRNIWGGAVRLYYATNVNEINSRPLFYPLASTCSLSTIQKSPSDMDNKLSGSDANLRIECIALIPDGDEYLF